MFYYFTWLGERVYSNVHPVVKDFQQFKKLHVVQPTQQFFMPLVPASSGGGGGSSESLGASFVPLPLEKSLCFPNDLRPRMNNNNATTDGSGDANGDGISDEYDGGGGGGGSTNDEANRHAYRDWTAASVRMELVHCRFSNVHHDTNHNTAPHTAPPAALPVAPTVVPAVVPAVTPTVTPTVAPAVVPAVVGPTVVATGVSAVVPVDVSTAVDQVLDGSGEEETEQQQAEPLQTEQQPKQQRAEQLQAEQLQAALQQQHTEAAASTAAMHAFKKEQDAEEQEEARIKEWFGNKFCLMERIFFWFVAPHHRFDRLAFNEFLARSNAIALYRVYNERREGATSNKKENKNKNENNTENKKKQKRNKKNRNKKRKNKENKKESKKEGSGDKDVHAKQDSARNAEQTIEPIHAAAVVGPSGTASSKLRRKLKSKIHNMKNIMIGNNIQATLTMEEELFHQVTHRTKTRSLVVVAPRVFCCVVVLCFVVVYFSFGTLTLFDTP